MTNTYLFYDIETTGLNKAFDQILQFAAIRTDQELSEIDRHAVTIKLRPDVIPSPEAILTNRIPINALSSGLCEYEAVGKIHRLMNQSGTISIGYNTLGFDDEFLRFSFHRNLLPPYSHQYRNGCRRMDLFPMAILYRLYKKDVLVWPEIDGKPSLKLEHLGSANGIIAGQSHDALVDVTTTVELARRFFKKKKMWRYLQGYFDKETDAHRMKELPLAFKSGAGEHQKGLLISGEYGPLQNYQVPVISIGSSIPYPNQTLWLRLDQPLLRETTPQSIPDTTWIIRKRLGEPAILLPPRDRYWKRIGEERSAVFEENLAWLQKNPDIFQKIVKDSREYRYPFIPDLDPDASLYQIGFYSRADEKLCRKFHQVPLEKKANLVDQFSSPDARALALRILGRNYPDFIPPDFVEDFKTYLARINPSREEDAMVDYRDHRRTTPAGALIEISRLKKSGELNDQQLLLLDNLESHIRKNFQL
jgi:exodeoxyribonuclease-1